MNTLCRRVGAGLALGLLLAASAFAQPAAQYRFRQTLGGTQVQPAQDLLEPDEKAFLQAQPELRVGISLQDNRPYEVVDERREISGIQVEILTHVAQALGLRVRPVILRDFPESLAALRERRIDVLPAVGYDPSRREYLALSLGTAPNPGAVIGRAADPRFDTQPTLNGRRVALERGFVTRGIAQRLYPELLLSDKDDTAQALRAVALGEDDYYFGSLLRAMDVIERGAIAGLQVKRTLAYGTGQMHFGVRSDWPLLVSAINKAVAALRSVPTPELQAALAALQLKSRTLPQMLTMSAAEQRRLAERGTLRVGAVRGLTLLNEATPDGGHAGIASDYLQQVVQRLGVAVDVVPFDSVAQMLDGLRQGTIDLVPLLTYTPGRAREFAYSQPYLEMPYLIVARVDAPMYWDLDSLRGKRLALAQQHPLREYLAQRYPDIRIVEAPPGDGAMDMVAARQADAAVEVRLFANIRINADPHGVLRLVAPVKEVPAQFHFAASRAAASLVPLIDRALAEIDDGERQRMLRRWVAIDLQPAFHWQRYRTEIAVAGTALLLLIGASAGWARRLSREVQVRRSAEARLTAVADGLPGLVFQSIVGPDGKLQDHYLSAGATEFLGTEVARTPNPVAALAQHMPAVEAEALLAARRDSLRTLAPFKQTLRFHDPRRGERWLHCEAVARQLPDGQVAWTGYVVDVSSERALQGRLLDEVQAKNLFVATASHELRAPLNAISLALERLGSGPLDPAQRQVWRIAQDSAGALAGLIDNVLDLAKLEAGRMVLRPTVVDLAGLLQQLVDNHRLAAESRGLRLTLNLAPELPRRVSIDALRLRQILVNLVSNAIKYTPQGEVRVDARRLDGADGAATLLLRVSDTGIGIAPERQQALFQPFETVHNAADAPQEGSTGLGLAICRRLTDAMGGRIALISAPGQGTEVTVELPLVAMTQDDTATPATAGVLLLVDDDAVSRLLLADTLRAAGFEVAEATDIDGALLRWHDGDVAALITDQHMPGGSGLQLITRIADNAQKEGLPLPRMLLCSGSAPEAEHGLEQVDAVLRKPVTSAQLLQALAGLGLRGTR